MGIDLKRASSWITGHPHTLISFGIGLLGGVFLAMPLGWKLTGEAPSLIGAAVGVAGAVGAGLWAANRKQFQEDARYNQISADRAAIIAKAICDELITNWFTIERAISFLDAKVVGAQITEWRFAGFSENIGYLRHPVFLLLKDDVHNFGKEVASSVVTAYGTIAASRATESELRRPGRPGEVVMSPEEEIRWMEQYLEVRGGTCRALNNEVREAIQGLWPLTPYPVAGHAVPNSINDIPTT